MKSGKRGEDFVCEYLKKRGAKILCRNYICRFGEIDIISQIDDILIFTEVKTREENSLVLPIEAVDLNKQRKLIKSAEVYIKFTANYNQPRFDVASVVTKEGKPISVDYLENAFFAKGTYL